MQSEDNLRLGIIILCRMGSKRLPGKSLENIGGKTLLQHVYSRVKRATLNHRIVIATTDLPEDDQIENYCIRNNIECFRGSALNVRERLLNCAEKFQFDGIVRINADRLFLDYNILREMITVFETNHYDLVTNVPNCGFPGGFALEIFKYQTLLKFSKDCNNPYNEEHVTTILYNNEESLNLFKYRNKDARVTPDKPLAIDTYDDLMKSKLIFNQSPSRFGKLTMSEAFESAQKLGRPQSKWQKNDIPYLIAEIGGNHEGDFDYAMSLVDLAVEAQVDCIKFQIYSGNKLVNAIESPSRNAHFKKFELSMSQHKSIAQKCIDNGIDYLSSVWDLEALNEIDDYLPFYKVGSGDLTNWIFLRELATREKPIILSTGLSTLDEVCNTVRFLIDENPIYRSSDFLCVMQCTSMYPIDDDEANLSVLSVYDNEFDITLGYSDHTRDAYALEIATAMGARVLEFHFTDNRDNRSFRDHSVSLLPDEVLSLKAKLCRIQKLRGDGNKIPMPSEVSEGHVTSFRRGIYCGSQIKAGDIITKEHLNFLRPNEGLDARDFNILVGAEAIEDISVGARFEKGINFEPTKGKK